jgi:cytochrome b6
VSEEIKDSLLFDRMLSYLSQKEVPQHRYSFWYYFGGVALFCFVIQVLSGILLLIYYSPTPNTAYESILYITTSVKYGWFIRSLHHWTANLLILVVLIHLSSTFFMRAYRKPREFTWVSGVFLLFILFGFCFTGSLLPWDTTAYFATQIGTEIPKSTPFIGNLVTHFLRGGEFIGEESLKRFFALHVSILPLLSLIVISFHLILNQIHGTSIPIGLDKTTGKIPFYPTFLYRDIISWTTSIILLVWLSLLIPIQAGFKADPYSSAPLGIKPEWYFLPFFETLKIFPSTILSVNGEMIVNVLVGLFGMVLLLVPFLDRKAQRGEINRVTVVFGSVILVYFVISLVRAFFNSVK